MANPILVGYDPGRRDRAPVDFGVAAASFTGAPLIIAAVHAGTSALGPDAEAIVEDGLEESAGESLDHLAEDLRRHGVEAGLVVIGSTERGAVGRLLPAACHGASRRRRTAR
jgi:hypothetical protein